MKVIWTLIKIVYVMEVIILMGQIVYLVQIISVRNVLIQIYAVFFLNINSKAVYTLYIIYLSYINSNKVECKLDSNMMDINNNCECIGTTYFDGTSCIPCSN